MGSGFLWAGTETVTGAVYIITGACTPYSALYGEAARRTQAEA